jgi:hypothetical protein
MLTSPLGPKFMLSLRARGKLAGRQSQSAFASVLSYSLGVVSSDSLLCLTDGTCSWALPMGDRREAAMK